MTVPNTERNLQVYQRYLEGTAQKEIGVEFGISQQMVSVIIRRARNKLTAADRSELIRDLVAETQRSRSVLAEMRDTELRPPAFDQRGRPLIDPRTGAVVEDVSPIIAATQALRSQGEALAKLLGLNAPDKIQSETSVHYVIEGVNIDDMK